MALAYWAAEYLKVDENMTKEQTLDTYSSRKKRILGILLILGLAGLGWITITVYRRALMMGYVDSAIVSMRTLIAAEAKFAEAHPDLGYTCTLSALATDKRTAGMVKNERNGYTFEITGCRAEGGKGPNSTYQVTARPLRPGMPVFCSDQSGIVKSDVSGSVPKCLESGMPL